MSAERSFPPDAVVRMHIRQDPDGSPLFLVVTARPPIEAVPESIIQAGSVTALLTHAAGVSWPCRRGEAIAQAALQDSGVVMFGFRTLADALGCQRTCLRRLEEGRRDA